MPVLSGPRRSALGGPAVNFAPILADLSAANLAFTTDAPVGAVIWTPPAKKPGSTMSFASADGRLAFDAAGRLVVAAAVNGADSVPLTVIETLLGAQNSPRPSPIVVAISAPPSVVQPILPSIAGKPLVGNVLTANTGSAGSGAAVTWLANGVVVGTGATYTVAAADAASAVIFTISCIPAGGGAALVSKPTLPAFDRTAVVGSNGSAVTASNGTAIVGRTAPASFMQMLAPYSGTPTTVNQFLSSPGGIHSSTSNPFIVAIADEDRFQPAAAGVPFGIFAGGQAMVEVWIAGVKAATFYPDLDGYAFGTLDLSPYANGPRYVEVRSYDTTIVSVATLAYFAGFDLFLIGGTNTDTRARPVGAAGLSMVFQDDFRSLSVSRGSNASASRWYDQMPTYKNFGDQYFASASSAQNPYQIVDTFLRIRERYDANYNLGTSGRKWASGLLSTGFPDGSVSAPLGYGYYEWRSKIPIGSGTWPAEWLLDQDGILDTNAKQYTHQEIDVREQYNWNMLGYTANHHKYASAAQVAAGANADPYVFARVVTVDQRWEFHRVGVLVTPSTLYFYFDDRLVNTQANFITSGPSPGAYYALFNLALGAGYTVIVPPSSYFDYWIDYFRYYAA